MALTAEQALVGTRVKIPTQKKGQTHPDHLFQFHEGLQEAHYYLPYLLISSINLPFIGLNFDKVAHPLPDHWNLVVNCFYLEDLDLHEPQTRS